MCRGFKGTGSCYKKDDEIMTKILKIENDLSLLKEAGDVIKNGGLVAFPTETVYGIGANGLCPDAVRNVFKAKNRPMDNPLILHIAEYEEAEKIGYMNPAAKKIAESFWSGPVTVIVKKKDIVPSETSAGLDTVAIRMPSSPVARELIKYAGVPIAAPSANLSTKPSATRFEDVYDDLNGRVDMIVDGGGCSIGIESTVVDTTSDIPTILRPGGITYEQLCGVLGRVEVEKHKKEGSEDYKPKSPGMKYKHYAPKAKVIVYEENAEEKIALHLKENKEKGIKTGIFCKTTSSYDCDCIINWGENASEMASVLFSALRDFDRRGAEEILCEMPETAGLGMGVRNRIYKSAGFDIR